MRDRKKHFPFGLAFALAVILIVFILVVMAVKQVKNVSGNGQSSGVDPSSVTERPAADLEIPNSTSKQSLNNLSQQDASDRERQRQEDIISALTPSQKVIYDGLTKGDPQCEEDTECSKKSSGILALLYMKKDLTKEQVLWRQIDYAFYIESVSGDKNALGLAKAMSAYVYADTMDTENHTVEANYNGLDCTLSYTVNSDNEINGLSVVKMDGMAEE